MAKDVRFEMRMSQVEADLLDRRRGSASRSAYMRSLLLDPRWEPKDTPVKRTEIEVAHEHRWRKVSDFFDICDACDERRPHQKGTR
jgi:hypothetical protein